MDLGTISTALELLGKARTALQGLAQRKRVREETDFHRVVEDFFGGELDAQDEVRTRGVLSRFGLIGSSAVYQPRIVRVESETHQLANGVVESQLKFGGDVLQPPCRVLPTIELEDGSKAALAWLYPDSFSGFSFAYNQNALPATTDEFSVSESQKPILCLLKHNSPPSRVRRAVCRGRVVAVSTDVVRGFEGALSPFLVNHLSNCLRQFGTTSGALAIDLREEGAITWDDTAIEIPAVIGVDAIISGADLTQLHRGIPLSNFIIDAIPERTGSGPMRGVSTVGDQFVSVLSHGSGRWLHDSQTGRIGYFERVDLASESSMTEVSAKMAVSYSAWQKKARNSARTHSGIDLFIRPVLCFDPSKISLFSVDGLKLRPDIEKLLFGSANARQGIDWLRVAVEGK